MDLFEFVIKTSKFLAFREWNTLEKETNIDLESAERQKETENAGILYLCSALLSHTSIWATYGGICSWAGYSQRGRDL